MDANKANRQVCDVDIRELKTKKPFLFFKTANTTTAGLSSEASYAMAKGSKRISFPNPLEGTMSIEAQVYPFKYFAMLSDGTIEDTAEYAKTATVKATEAGKLTFTLETTSVESISNVFVYKKGGLDFGDDDSLIEGTYADNAFTATTSNDITVGTEYEVGYIVKKKGVRKVTFNNEKLPKDFYVTMSTVEKTDDGVYAPFKMVAYKTSPQRNFELSFNSEGDPASVNITFDLLTDKDGNCFDMIELDNEDADKDFDIAAG